MPALSLPPSRCCKNRKGFMFIELLIVIGIMGILATLMVIAINPAKHLCEAHNAGRLVTEGELAKALNQFTIMNANMPAPGIPVGFVNAKAICRPGVVGDPSCINLDVIVPDFLVALPTDMDETSTVVTGYAVYRMSALMDKIEVMSVHTQVCAS